MVPWIRRRIAPLAVLLGAWLLASCFGTGGGGSDTETLSGTLTSQGAPLAGARIKLVPTEYDPALPGAEVPRLSQTDAAGRFRFDGLDAGRRFNLLAGDAQRGWAFAESLRADGGTHALALAPPRTFLVTLLGDVYPTLDSGRVYFPGTDILARCDGLGATRIDSIPRGVRRIVVESKAGWRHDTVLVNTGDTLRIEANRQGVICQSPFQKPSRAKK